MPTVHWGIRICRIEWLRTSSVKEAGLYVATPSLIAVIHRHFRINCAETNLGSEDPFGLAAIARLDGSASSLASSHARVSCMANVYFHVS